MSLDDTTPEVSDEEIEEIKKYRKRQAQNAKNSRGRRNTVLNLEKKKVLLLEEINSLLKQYYDIEQQFKDILLNVITNTPQDGTPKLDLQGIYLQEIFNKKDNSDTVVSFEVSSDNASNQSKTEEPILILQIEKLESEIKTLEKQKTEIASNINKLKEDLQSWQKISNTLQESASESLLKNRVEGNTLNTNKTDLTNKPDSPYDKKQKRLEIVIKGLHDNNQSSSLLTTSPKKNDLIKTSSPNFNSGMEFN